MSIFFYQKITSVVEDIEKPASLCAVGRNVKWHSHYGKRSGSSSEIKHKITKWLSNSTSRYISKRTESRVSRRYLYPHSHSKDRGWDGWMVSLTRWTWVWANPGDGGGQGSLAGFSPWDCKVRQDWVTELNGTDIHSSITFNLQKVETTQESIEELMDDQNMVHLHNGTQGMQVGSLGQEDPPWRRAWQPTPVFLPGESHGQRSLAGYSL